VRGLDFGFEKLRERKIFFYKTKFDSVLSCDVCACVVLVLCCVVFCVNRYQ
jgi:hypothetical protein